MLPIMPKFLTSSKTLCLFNMPNLHTESQPRNYVKISFMTFCTFAYVFIFYEHLVEKCCSREVVLKMLKHAVL